MDPTLKIVALLMMLLGLVGIVSATSADFSHCEEVVKDWAFSSLAKEAKNDKHTLRDLLFFLHIPRTGGRTYFHCFLRKLYSSSEECPRSYDKLRFDPSKQKCRLLVSHDDFTMMSKLPEEKTSVVTILRSPVDRVFSTYEFSVEVAARFLVHPNLTSATQMTGRLRSKGVGVSTLDIWPWKYLVPWMRQDLFARRDARKHKGSNNLMTSDPYNMKEMVMPLHQYINDPIAHDIVHNGATFQITGLTNNSNFAESHEVRHCVQKYNQLGKYVLQVAKKRLDDMLYVGLTENHKGSATMFAHVVGAQVISQALEVNSSVERAIDDRSANNTSVLDSEPDADFNHINALDQVASGNTSTKNPESKKENLTVEKLMDSYEECISNLRKTQARRRSASLKRIAPANFSKEDRNRVSEDVINLIESLNNLDLELYHYAVELFTKQHERMVQKVEETPSIFTNAGTPVTIWGVLILVTLFGLVIVIYLYVNSIRKTSKLKI